MVSWLAGTEHYTGESYMEASDTDSVIHMGLHYFDIVDSPVLLVWSALHIPQGVLHMYISVCI